ncbi:hypothetical protein D5045_10110 [Verminephrobacter eiseniae]|uniref:hypothetical protein n=1 Tax=Verminephrobacter eiseniae TaxID=364317 RepID=UPI002238BD5F|nr:hypothetical protein [Verminephrobacter eiseniae]MCW5260564.1 hypothetical protein [Verminephrobacter eiseniae]
MSSISRPRSSGIAVRTVQGRGHAQCGFIELALDPQGGRARIATLTPSGSAIHDQIREAAMESERAFMSALAAAERKLLLNLLRRLHESLPAVEAATSDHFTPHHPHALQRRGPKDSES